MRINQGVSLAPLRAALKLKEVEADNISCFSEAATPRSASCPALQNVYGERLRGRKIPKPSIVNG